MTPTPEQTREQRRSIDRLWQWMNVHRWDIYIWDRPKVARQLLEAYDWNEEAAQEAARKGD